MIAGTLSHRNSSRRRRTCNLRTPSPSTPPANRTPIPPPTPSMDDDATATPPPESQARPPPPMPVREDCWAEDATHTLIEAWGDRYMDLNRGNLRQKHWKEVADAVNAHHGHVRKARRTDVQCKNRIDTLKKKYKVEKARVLDSRGEYNSQWPFFPRLDALIGSSYKPSPPVMNLRKNTPAPVPALPALPPPSMIPVGPRSKRPPMTPSPVVGDSLFRRNFSAMAAAAAAVAAQEESETSGSGSGSRSRSSAGSRRRREGKGDESFQQLAEAIQRFGEIYERVEDAKQRQMIELEKHRMLFAKDLEIQRMKLFLESQIQLEKIKRSKRSSETDFYL